MPIREYECEHHHITEKIISGKPPAKVNCNRCSSVARLIEVSLPFVPSDDYKAAEARRGKWKSGAQDTRE